MTPVRAVALLLGTATVVATGLSAVRTIVLPRSDTALMTRAVFRTVGWAFESVARRRRTYEGRDRVMSRFGPISMVALPAAWVVTVVAAGTAVFWGLGAHSPRDAFELSGSSFTTLGFTGGTDVPSHVASVVEALLGLGLVALLISYLPSIYASFQRRELAVALLEVRAGDPPHAVRLLVRHALIGRLDDTAELFLMWEQWFADVEETHTSQPVLPWFRSPQPGRSWITAAGAVLDSAALLLAAVDVPRRSEPALCIRAGTLSLRHIARLLGIAFDPDPDPTDPISIDRSEFDDACRALADVGVPLLADADQAWRDFAGWRVNYDRVLVGLAGRLMAPQAPWSSDRSLVSAGRRRRVVPASRRSG